MVNLGVLLGQRCMCVCTCSCAIYWTIRLELWKVLWNTSEMRQYMYISNHVASNPGFQSKTETNIWNGKPGFETKCTEAGTVPRQLYFVTNRQFGKPFIKHSVISRSPFITQLCIVNSWVSAWVSTWVHTQYKATRVPALARNDSTSTKWLEFLFLLGGGWEAGRAVGSGVSWSMPP